MAPIRYKFAGIFVDALNRKTAVARIVDLALQGGSSYVCVTGAHGVIESQTNPEFRAALLGAATVTPDGAPLAWFGKLVCGRFVSKVTGWPLVFGVFDDAQAWPKLRHFFVGASRPVTDGMVTALSARDPGCNIVGTWNPPFRAMTEPEIDELARLITSKNANVIWIGISTPRQEILAQKLTGRLPAGVAISCGAAFDFVAGTKPIVPELISKLGFEWLFRLLTEPKRLWRRYFVLIPQFFALFVVELIRLVFGRASGASRTSTP